MSNRLCRLGVLTSALILSWSALLQAQQAEPEPIKCWWKTDKTAVEVAEQFTLTLTCGVNEARGSKVVPKMELLDPGAVQLSPFEVVGGTRHDDIAAPPWRYFQYDYTLRLIDDDAFGEDEDIPGLTVTYNVQSDVPGAAPGRDQMYNLPDLPVRILSLVPKKATDIRDSVQESFAAPKARLVRATSQFIAAGILFGLSVLMVAFAVVHVVRRKRERAPVHAAALSDTRLMRACLQEISRLRSEALRNGWTPERAASVLTVLRIGTAVAIGRPVSQSPVDLTAPAREGQISVCKVILKRERIAVSSPITADSIERYRMNGNGRVTNVRTKAMIDDLGKSIIALSTLRYGRNGAADVSALNRSLENARAAMKHLLVATLWPMRTASALFQSADMLRNSIWTR